MKNKFGWCFIGAGNIARKCADEVIKSDKCYIASVWNRTHSKAIDFENKYHAKAYENVLDAINDPHVDAVYIALTNDRHFEYAKLCIENHKNVLLEKPFTMNEEQAVELFRLAKENDVYLAEAMWTWFNETAYKIKEWVDNKEVGKIKKVKSRFDIISVTPFYATQRLIDPNMLGGALLDLGVYCLRYSLELFGYPKKIECFPRLYKTGVDLGETVLFYYDDFVVDHHSSVDQTFADEYKIYGEDGVIDAGMFHMSKKAKLKSKNKKEIFKTDALLRGRQFDVAASEITSGLKTSKCVSKENTILCMRLLDTCRKQMGVIYPLETILNKDNK